MEQNITPQQALQALETLEEHIPLPWDNTTQAAELLKRFIEQQQKGA